MSYLDRLQEHVNNMTPEECYALIKSLGLTKKRRVIDDPAEQKQIMTMLRLLGPGEQSNNQHIWTESWRVGNIEYNIHSGENFEELEEVIDEDE